MSGKPNKPFYITTTLPYVNAEPHIGFAMEFIRADIIARAKKLAGQEVFFNTGTDEHGIKVFRKAQEQGKDAQIYVDGYAENYKKLIPALGIAADEPGIVFNFIRTTDPHHKAAAQEFWKIVDKNGYIYKKDYSIKYCVGCELEKTDSELVNGRCPLHPLQELEIIHEENYFFRFSAFKDKLLQLYKDRPQLVTPDFRFNEVKAFVERGLEDFSISRVASKMSWGVPVPGDPTQVMYVWFDALVSYISAIGWPNDMEKFKKWWVETGGVVQYCGKDNLRQQAAMWQAMLIAAGLSPSKTIVVDGFITGDGGIKMSKSLGNTVEPSDIVNEYGTDALRYYVARELSPFEDSPFTMEKFKEAYNAHLANGIGNLTSRIMKMVESNGIIFRKDLSADAIKNASLSSGSLSEFLDSYQINKACDHIWGLIQNTDKLIQHEEPFKTIKEDFEKGKNQILRLLLNLYTIGILLKPILPQTSQTIIDLVEANRVPAQPLFMRK